MKNYFFINPAAGQGKGIEKLIREIETVSHELGLESYIYITKSVLDQCLMCFSYTKFPRKSCIVNRALRSCTCTSIIS